MAGETARPGMTDVESIEFYLRQVSNVVRRRGRDILSGFDITPPQFNALLVLEDRQNMTMGELCDRLYLASSTVTDLVDRMEKNSLVERARDASDRRAIRLKVTDKGLAVVAQVMEARRRYLERVLHDVPTTKRDTLLRALRDLHQRIASVEHLG